jgi:hypothetical protein
MSDRHLLVDGADVARSFGSRPLAMRHELADHPAFGHAALLDVAERIPAAWGTAYRSGTEVLDARPTRSGVPSPEVVRSIATNSSRLTLYHLEHLSPYRELLRAHLDEWEAMTGEREDGTVKRAANVFMGAPGAVVPAHFDRHHNLLLQISGTKQLTVGWFREPAHTRRETEREFDQGRHGIATLPTETITFDLGPGDGVYIPAYMFHWVVGGPAVSIALSCGYSTAVTQRAEMLHQTNARIRRLGLPTRPPGRSAAVDSGKLVLYRSARRLQAVRRRNAS